MEASAETISALIAQQLALDDSLRRTAAPAVATVQEAGALSLAFVEEEFKRNVCATESLRNFVTHVAPGLVNKLSLQTRLRWVDAGEFDKLCQKRNQGTCLREALRDWLRSEGVAAAAICVPRLVPVQARKHTTDANSEPLYLLKMSTEFKGFEDPRGSYEVLCETGKSWCAELKAEVRWTLQRRNSAGAYEDVTPEALLPPPRVVTLLTLAWPLNLPPPSALRAGWPAIRHWFATSADSHYWRSEQGLEPGCWVPFVLLNGVTWAIEGREVPPLDHPLLRQWDRRNNSLAGRAPDTTFSRTLQTGPGAVVREVYKISATASTPGGTRRRAVVWHTGRAQETETNATSVGGGVDSPLAPARAPAEHSESEDNGGAATRCAQYHVDNMHNQEALVVGAKRQRKLHLYPNRGSAGHRDQTLRRSYGNRQNVPPTEFADAWATKMSRQRGSAVTDSCLPQARLQGFVRAQTRSDSALPVLTARVFVGQPCDLPFVLLWRALGISCWEELRQLVTRGDEARDSQLYLDLVHRSWALNEGVVTRDQALFRLGQLWCLRTKQFSVEQMQGQGLWWLRHRFLLHIFPGAAPWLTTAVRRSTGLPAGCATIIADYALDDDCNDCLLRYGDARKAEHLADGARALSRAEAGLPSLLAVSPGQPSAGLSDPLAMQNRAVLTLAQLYSHNLQRAFQRVRSLAQTRLTSWGGLAVCVDPNVLLDSAQMSRVFQEFASPRDRAGASDSQPLQRVLQHMRGNLAKKYSLARRVCQMVPSGQGMTSDQRFDVSQLSFLDPNETSKSSKSGYDKRLSLFTTVTPELDGAWAAALEDWLTNKCDVATSHPSLGKFVVECHGRLLGSTTAAGAERLLLELRALKRGAQGDGVADAGGLALRHLGLLLDRDEKRLIVHTYAGRLSAPVLHVNHGVVPLPACVRRVWARWRLRELRLPHDDTRSYLVSNHPPPPAGDCLAVWRALRDQGCLVWLSIQESAVQVGCESLSKFAAQSPPADFVDLSPARHLSFSSALTLFHEHVTGPRLVYAVGMQSQSIGQRQPGRLLVSSAKELLRGDRPLLESPVAACTLGVQPLGLNVPVAYRAWSHNQDDGTVWGQGAADRGLFAFLDSRAYYDRLHLVPPTAAPVPVRDKAGGWDGVLARTRAALATDGRKVAQARGCRSLEGYLLGKRRDDAWAVPLGRTVLPGDVLLRALSSAEPDGSDESCVRRTIAQNRGVVSQSCLALDGGRVWLDTNPAQAALRDCGHAQAYVRTVVTRLLPFQYGDKITNTSGQKCTLCVFVPDHVLPYLPTGERPAVLLGPSQMFRKTINDCVTTLQTRLIAQYGRQLTHDTIGGPASYVWPWNQELLAYTRLYALEQNKCRLWRPDFWWVLEAHCCPVAARLWRSCLEHWLRRASAQVSGPAFAALSKVLRLATAAYDVGAVPARGCAQKQEPHFHAGDGSCRDIGCVGELERWAHAEESWLLAQGRRAKLLNGPPAGGARRALGLALAGKELGTNWRRLLLPVSDWAAAAERAAVAVSRNLEATWDTARPATAPAPSPAGEEGGLQELHLRASARMYSPASMNLDPAANPTLFGFQYYMRQDKTSEVQFKVRHQGPMDPLTHQGTKSARVDGASKFDSMCLNAAVQSGSTALLEQVLQSADSRLDVVCRLCGRLGINGADGAAVCLTRSCSRASAAGSHPGLVRLPTTFVLLKALQTLDASGLMYKIGAGEGAEEEKKD